MIFLTGGTGLLGSHFLFDITSSGKRVRALRRRDSDTNMVRKIFSYYSERPDPLFDLIEWVEGDLQDYSSIEDALSGVTEIYHAGAVVSFYPKDHKAMLNININGTANLVNLSLEKNIGKFCYVSSVGTLGRADHNGLTNEETHWQQTSKNSVYSISKYGAEREVWRGMEEGLNALIVNPSVILGPGFWDDHSGFFRLVWKGLKYYTRGINGFVDVRDVARAMRILMEKNLFNHRFIVSADNLSYQQLFSMIAKYLDRPAPSVNVPPIVSNIVWHIESVRSFLTGSIPEITKELANISNQQYYYSSEKIHSMLGFDLKPVEESVKEICGMFLKDMN